MYVNLNLLCILKLKLMYIEVILLLCMLFLCWLDAKVYSIMVACTVR